MTVDDAGNVDPKPIPHIAYYDMFAGDPLTVGPFRSYVDAWGYVDGGHVAGDRGGRTGPTRW